MSTHRSAHHRRPLCTQTPALQVHHRPPPSLWRGDNQSLRLMENKSQIPNLPPRDLADLAQIMYNYSHPKNGNDPSHRQLQSCLDIKQSDTFERPAMGPAQKERSDTLPGRSPAGRQLMRLPPPASLRALCEHLSPACPRGEASFLGRQGPRQA